MNERRIREVLREAPVPSEHEAAERGWRVVSAAFERHRPAHPPRNARRMAIAIAVLLLILALALSPAGAKVADLVRDVTNIGNEETRPALTSLPAPGRLLVTSARGPWIVNEDGSKRLLGAYHEATWSPHGLYVAVTRGRQLVAVDPTGNVRWSLAQSHRVGDPRWSPSGFRIAYLSGSSLRIVAGDGTGDRLLAPHVAPTAAAWKPASALDVARITKGFGAEILAFADEAGRIHVVDADTGKALWISGAGPAPRELLWTPDGKELVAVGSSSLRVFDEQGSPGRSITLPRGTRAQTAQLAPKGKRLALVRTTATRSAGGRSEVELLKLGGGGVAKRRLPPEPGRFTDVAWSPNGQWLLVAWRDADQWLFIRPERPRGIRAVANISRQFDPGAKGRSAFPRIAGWCCSAD